MRYSLCFILLEKVNQISKSFLKSSLFCVLGLIVFHIEDLKWIFESSRILFFKSIFKWNINFRVQKSWTLKFQPLSWWSEYTFLNDMSSTIANYKFFFLKKSTICHSSLWKKLHRLMSLCFQAKTCLG